MHADCRAYMHMQAFIINEIFVNFFPTNSMQVRVPQPNHSTHTNRKFPKTRKEIGVWFSSTPSPFED
jgi:hypothetical protein